MRILIVEDEFTSRMQIKYFLEIHGTCDIAANGTEAVEAFKMALDAGNPYDLICLDIKLPDKNGHQVLKEIREMESQAGTPLDKLVKVFMTTALADIRNISDAYRGLCDEYLTKPIEKKLLTERLREHHLIR